MWTLDPKGSIGPLRIGMTEREYLSALTAKPKQFYRTKNSLQPTLAFSEDLVQLVIDAERKISKISVFRPQKVSLLNVQLLDRNLSHVHADLKRQGLDFSVVDAGLWNAENQILLVEFDGVVNSVELGFES